MDTWEADVRVFRELEECLLRPETRGSTEMVEALLHDEFLEFGRSGRRYTKVETVEALATERAGNHVVEIIGLQARHLSPDVVQVVYVSTRRAADGSARRHTLRSSVWVRADTRWRLIFHQGTPTDGEGASAS